MPDNRTRLQSLYFRFIRDEASPDEIREFWELMRDAGEDDPVHESVFDTFSDEDIPEEILQKNWSGAAERIIPQRERQKILSIGKWWWAAASAILLIGVYSFFKFGARQQGSVIEQPLSAGMIPHDVAPPALNHATITLANGQKIFLDSTGNGLLALQNQVALKKTGDGKVVYQMGVSGGRQEMVYNTLTNPRGSRVIDMMLSDGSHVWLNSGSSLTFPVAFNDKDRRVSMTGEAYFEVAHDAAKKFFVEVNGLTTEVLGTHFNVNSYEDEDAVRVSLFEGKVNVMTSGGQAVAIRPGEQAEKNPSGEVKVNRNINSEEVLAWKNEMFIFNETNIREVMREMARWYDVDVEYRGNFSDLDFGGSMSRQKNVSELLKRLEATKAVRFEVNGKKITVIKGK